MSLFGIDQAIIYVQKEKYNFGFAASKEEIRGHVTNVAILIENIIKESIRIYGYLFFGQTYVHMLKNTIDVNIDSKLMFGEALKGLSRLYRLTFDQSRNLEFQSLFSRNQVYFKKHDPLYYKLKEISQLRGAIIHDEQSDITSLSGYKEKGRRCIHLCEQALNQIKIKQLFPSVLVYHSTVDFEEKKIVYFVDDIGASIPFDISQNIEMNDIKTKKWYMFKNAKIQKLIPVFSDLLPWGNEDLRHQFSTLRVIETPTMIALGLLEITENKRSRWYNVYNEVTFIGRSEENDLILKFPSISRKHCKITHEKDRTYVTDLNSTYGTYVNGKKIAPLTDYSIKDGDCLSVGLGAEQVILKYFLVTSDNMNDKECSEQLGGICNEVD
ncbi:hypothetical protein C4A76_24810 [Brevibacillus laterosporus]|uniref:FHA domain-containing protein n=1 Tax=Brevibacillus laterosporus TaxID=1465 RepID=UPI000CE42E0F|nr:FHA domain-containing protein [Brevibacillus laterosporus]PPA80907.1 hypothetical protein C4A76_24810 [Brevibacillus laterosporus]